MVCLHVPDFSIFLTQKYNIACSRSFYFGLIIRPNSLQSVSLEPVREPENQNREPDKKPKPEAGAGQEAKKTEAGAGQEKKLFIFFGYSKHK